MALLYGVVKTGFPEELLFRGLIAGSLARRLRSGWANLLQALVFLAPHLLVLRVMPEMWWIILFVFGGALIAGWLRIRSGSIIGPWLIHAFANVAICLSVAARTGSPH
jgi:membrane protease YdiL (CAAX protease family)